MPIEMATTPPIEEEHQTILIQYGQTGMKDGNIIIRIPFEDRLPIYLSFPPKNNYGSAISICIATIAVLIKCCGLETAKQFEKELLEMMGMMFHDR